MFQGPHVSAAKTGAAVRWGRSQAAFASSPLIQGRSSSIGSAARLERCATPALTGSFRLAWLPSSAMTPADTTQHSRCPWPTPQHGIVQRLVRSAAAGGGVPALEAMRVFTVARSSGELPVAAPRASSACHADRDALCVAAPLVYSALGSVRCTSLLRSLTKDNTCAGAVIPGRAGKPAWCAVPATPEHPPCARHSILLANQP
jgi:hypothetical protein